MPSLPLLIRDRNKISDRTHARTHARMQHAGTQCTTTRPKPPVAARPQQVQRCQWTSLRPRQALYVAGTAMVDSENRHKCLSPSFRPTDFAAAPAPQGRGFGDLAANGHSTFGLSAHFRSIRITSDQPKAFSESLPAIVPCAPGSQDIALWRLGLCCQ